MKRADSYTQPVAAKPTNYARQRALVGILISVGLVVAMTMAPFNHQLLRAGPSGIALFALGLLVTIGCVAAATGSMFELWRAMVKHPAARAELWDELTQANTAKSLAVGYWCMWSASFALLFASQFWPLTLHWSLLTIFGLGSLVQAIWFAWLERNGDDAGD